MRVRLGLTIDELWTVLAVALPVLAAVIAPLSTVDLAYLVRAGELMLGSGALVATDPFTFSAAGQPWLNQQWGAELVVGAVYRVGGWASLALLRAILVGSIFWLVQRACRRAGAEPRTAALLTLAGFLVAAPALGLRAQLFGMLCFALVVVLLGERDRGAGTVWLTVPVVIVWVNVHGSFVLGPPLIAFAALEDLMAHRSRGRQVLRVAAVAAIATLVNPFGPGAWGYLLALGSNPWVTQLVTEWQPPSPRSADGLLFFGSAVAVAMLLARSRRAVPWLALAWFGALFALGLWTARGIAWWALGAPVMAASLISAWTAATRPTRRMPVNGLIGAVLAFAIAGLVVIPWLGAPRPPFASPGLLRDAPEAITRAVLAEADASDRIFAFQLWGSWFELAVPGVPVFVGFPGGAHSRKGVVRLPRGGCRQGGLVGDLGRLGRHHRRGQLRAARAGRTPGRRPVLEQRAQRRRGRGLRPPLKPSAPPERGRESRARGSPRG